MLASTLYPYDEDAPKRIERWLTELEEQQCLRRYTVEGDAYLEITKWLKHQKIDRPSASRLPAFDASSRGLDVSSTYPRRASDADLDLVPSTRTKDQGPITTASAANFEAFWIQCPKKIGKGGARKAYAAALDKTSPEILLAGIIAHARSMSGKDDKYIPHPATWLNQERWMDQHATPNGNGISEPRAPREPAPAPPELKWRDSDLH